MPITLLKPINITIGAVQQSTLIAFPNSLPQNILITGLDNKINPTTQGNDKATTNRYDFQLFQQNVEIYSFQLN